MEANFFYVRLSPLFSRKARFASLLFCHIQTKGSSRVHNIIRVKMIFQGTENIHSLTTNRLLNPLCCHFPDTMMMTHGSTAGKDIIKNSRLVFEVFLLIIKFPDKDEVKISSLWIGM